MQGTKKIPTKNQLLDWLNSTLKSSGLSITKIQQLGNGVGYLALLSHIHPGILIGIKYNKKPTNQYEYHFNLKLLASAFTRLGIDKHVDIQKLSKLKMQDNLAMLQWFYNYAHQQMAKDQKEVTHDHQKQQKQDQIKKIKVRAGEKLIFNLPEKSTKIQIQDDQQVELKALSSATRRITEIDEVIKNKAFPNNQTKLLKIMNILGIKDSKNPLMMTPVGHGAVKKHQYHQQQFKDQNIREQNIQKAKKQQPYIKCRRLEQKYEQYLKTSILKKPEQQLLSNNPKQQSRQSVKLSDTKQIFSYNTHTNTHTHVQSSATTNQNMNISTNANTNTNTNTNTYENSMRKTDNSILLQSDRKSVQSQTNLLQEE